MPIEDLFATTATHLPGMSKAEWSAELGRLVQRQNAIAAACRGELPADVLLDMLAEHLIDPYDWMDAAVENVEILTCGPMG